MVDAQSILMLQETYTTTLVFLPMWYWDKTTVTDPTMLTKLKNAIKMMNGVSSISIMRPKKTGLELAEEDKAKGRVTQWNSVDEMFDTVLGE